MRFVFVILAVFGLAGCATNYSSLDDPNDKAHSKLVVGDMDAVRSSIRQAIGRQFPGCKVDEPFYGTFIWLSEQSLNYRLDMGVGTGLDDNKNKVKGYFYTIGLDYSETYMTPAVEAVERELASAGLKTTKVALLSRTTMKDEAVALAEQAQACFGNIADDPKFVAVKDKISFGTAADQPFAMLTDTRKPAPEEKQEIRLWGEMREGCLQLQRKANNTLGTDPQIKVLMDSLVTNQQSLIAQLYLGNLTYGEFATKRQALANGFKESASNIEAQLKNAERESNERMMQVEAIHDVAGAVRSAAMSQSSHHSVACNFLGNTMYCN